MPRVTPEYEQSQKKRIVNGATAVFAAHGYRQTTIDQISESLHLSKGAIYLYFKSKEELFISVLQSIYEYRFEALSAACQTDAPLTVRFKKMLDCLSGMMAKNYDVFTRLSIEAFLESDHIPRLQIIKNESYHRFYELLYRLLQEGQTSSTIHSEVDISSVTTILLAVSDGLMLHSLVRDRGIDPERVRQSIQETFSSLLKSGD
jgi:AcrR family transcriptional regulator